MPKLLLIGLWLLAAGQARAQDRDTKVRNDRETFRASEDWIYNDLEAGVRAAKAAGKPLLVVFRCIPCEACQEFDDDVARRDPILRGMLDQFVCVRIVQANSIDLTRFQHDFDQSFVAYLMNPDLTIYGRFGTRSERLEAEDISLEGLRKAMEAALRMHRDDDEAVKRSLAGKQVRTTRYRTPRDYPGLAGKYGTGLNYEGQVARTCMHCHQVLEAERLVYRAAGEPIPDEVVFPSPDPGVLGLTMHPKEMATIARVAPGSSADRDGFRPGDEIVRLEGQPLLSIADLQWVLHNATATARLTAHVRRDGETLDLALTLRQGWRRGNISWRASTWDLRRMGFGGLMLEDLTDEERRDAGLSEDAMALRVEHVGESGAHAVAKRAGFKKGDIVVAFDGRDDRMTESQLLAYAVQVRRPSDEVTVTVLRDGKREVLKYALQ
jgi:serine protease Do